MNSPVSQAQGACLKISSLLTCLALHYITCENAEKQLPKNCEESNHESTTHSGEGANKMRDFQNTPAHAGARVTMRVPGAPSVTGHLCCLSSLLNAAVSPV